MQILIPTYNRPDALAVTLTALAAQAHDCFAVTIADQSDLPVARSPVVANAIRVLAMHGRPVTILRNLPRRGLAQQRTFLLDQVTVPLALLLDDDLVLEPWVLALLQCAIERERCGFVGNAPIGLSHADDFRPHEQGVEWWHGPIDTERVECEGAGWARHRLDNAANVLHLQRALAITPDAPRLYRLAWVGGCVLYDTAKLRAAGGFGFWRELPDVHAGEDVLAQLRVMARFGGAGVLPSGVYHQELPTTIPERDVDAPRALTIHE